MARKEGFQKPRRLETVVSRATEAKALDESMTPMRRRALNEASELYKRYAEPIDKGSRIAVIDNRVLRTAHTLIRFANGDEGVLYPGRSAMELLSNKSNKK